MFPRVCNVRYVKDYTLEITFSDGTVAELDFRHRVVGRGGVFVPMEELEFFRQVTVDRESGTVSWPNGVDFCPDVLYAEATGKVISEMGSKLELI
jgi:hypothetical protein